MAYPNDNTGTMYPGAVSDSTDLPQRTTGQVVEASHMNLVQQEVVQIEKALGIGYSTSVEAILRGREWDNGTETYLDYRTTGGLAKRLSDVDLAIANYRSHRTANSDVHGIGSGSSVVGTNTTQNLLNKTINKVTITEPSTSATLTIANGKTLSVSNSLTFTGTDTSSVNFGSGGTVAYTGENLSQFASTTSSQLAGIVSDETGSGSLVFATSPTLVTPTLGAATATTINKVAITAPSNGATLVVEDGKTFTASNTLTFAGTDGTTMTFPSSSGTVVTLSATQTLTGKTLTSPTINGGTHTAITNFGIRSTGSGAFDLFIRNTDDLTANRTLTINVNNAGRTLDLSGNLTTSGGDAITLTTTGATNVTLPTSGTLVTSTDLDTKQPLDGDLTSIASLTSTGFAARTATSTYALRSMAVSAPLLISNASGVAGNPTISMDGIVPRAYRRLSSDGTAYSSGTTWRDVFGSANSFDVVANTTYEFDILLRIKQVLEVLFIHLTLGLLEVVEQVLLFGEQSAVIQTYLQQHLLKSSLCILILEQCNLQ
jgi:hypothetical protein